MVPPIPPILGVMDIGGAGVVVTKEESTVVEDNSDFAGLEVAGEGIAFAFDK